MTENKTLSEKREQVIGGFWVYPEEDIKETIQRIKKELCKCTNVKPCNLCRPCRIIDKHVGRDLR